MTITPKNTPTARELVAAAKRSGSSLPVTAPATADYRERYLNEIAPSGTVGRMIKFSKDGEFITHDDGASVSSDATFLALCDQTLIGLMKFNGAGEPPTRHMGLFYDGFVMPSRESLGDLDQTKWEIGLNGQPADPWQHHMYLVLQDTETSELFTFVTSSPTGRKAVGNLLRHYNRMCRSAPGELPTVRLSKGRFAHKDSRVGWVAVPVFVVVGRSSRDMAVKPEEPASIPLNDPIPM
jgi:hypothetical protein